MVWGIGDLDQDGYADIIIGAPKATFKSRTFCGSAYIVYGSSSKDENQAQIDENTFITIIQGANSADQFGVSVGAVGRDVNNDGIIDIIIGANEASALQRISSGTTYLIYGWRERVSIVDLKYISIQQVVRLFGAPDSNSGAQVHLIEDYDGDGTADILIGAPNASPFGREGAGIVYLIYGKLFVEDVDLSTIDNLQGLQFYGT